MNRLARLLALAADPAASPHEREAARRAAGRYTRTRALEGPPDVTRSTLDATALPWKARLAHVCGRITGAFTATRGSTIEVYGRDAARATCAQLYHALRAEADRRAMRVAASTGPHAHAIRTEYRLGFVDGVWTGADRALLPTGEWERARATVRAVPRARARLPRMSDAYELGRHDGARAEIDTSEQQTLDRPPRKGS